MGRAKLNMELIPNEKSRNSTFTKRKQGLIKKLHEFATLCGVPACMIIYGPNAAAPEIWPVDDLGEVHRMIDLYKKENKDASGSYCRNNFGLPDFFRDRERKLEEELEKLKRKNLEAKYPTKVDLDLLSVTELREFAAALGVKAQILRNRIDLLRRNKRRLLELGSQSNQEMAASNRFHYTPSLFGPVAPPPHVMQYPVVGAAAPPHQVSQFYPMVPGNVDFRHFDGGLQGTTLPLPQHYEQYGVVGRMAPPPQMQFQPPENSGFQDNLQYYHQM